MVEPEENAPAGGSRRSTARDQTETASCKKNLPGGKTDLRLVMNEPFPDVVFLPRVFKKGRLGQYRERARPRRIELSEALAMADKTTRKYVVLHEIGHWFRTTYVPGRLARGVEERFAHSFAMAISKPGALRAADPVAYQRLRALLSSGAKRRIAGFAGQILRKIK